MAVLRWLITLVMFSFLVIFCVQNMEFVDLHFRLTPAPAAVADESVPVSETSSADGKPLLEKLSFEISMPVFLLVLISVIAGAALGALVGLADQMKLRSQMRKKAKLIQKLEGEVKTLRNLPLEEEGEEAFKA